MKRALAILAAFTLGLVGAGTAFAAGASSASNFQFVPIVPLPLPGAGGALSGNTSLGCYVNSVFQLALTAAVILAVIMIIIDGFKYMASEVVTEKKNALAGIRSALFGLIILLASVLILTIINPELVSLNVLGFGNDGACASLPTNAGGGLAEPALENNRAAVPGPSLSPGSPPDTSLVASVPGAGEVYGHGDYYFTTKTGGTERFPDLASCQSAQQNPANQAAMECVSAAVAQPSAQKTPQQ